MISWFRGIETFVWVDLVPLDPFDGITSDLLFPTLSIAQPQIAPYPKKLARTTPHEPELVFDTPHGTIDGGSPPTILHSTTIPFEPQTCLHFAGAPTPRDR